MCFETATVRGVFEAHVLDLMKFVMELNVGGVYGVAPRNLPTFALV